MISYSKNSKHTFSLILYFLIFPSLIIGATNDNWVLAWSDEFDSSYINHDIWEYDTGATGYGNAEWENYTDKSDNSYIENGSLVIEAKKIGTGLGGFTSARMKTIDKISFKYGKIEAKIKMPIGNGIWPAFWMLGQNISSKSWPACGEIDIMEHINSSSDAVGTIHWKGADGNHAQYGNSTATDVTQWHVYGIEWDSLKIKWYVDDVYYHEADITNSINSTEEFHEPFFLILNLAIGGTWPGYPDETTIFPAKLYFDYIRVYSKENTGSIYLGNSSNENKTEEEIISEYGPNNEVIKNNRFDNEFENWDFSASNGASATYNIDTGNKYVSVDISKIGINIWDIQIGQPSIALIKNHEYQLTLRAKSSSNKEINFGVAKNGGDYSPYFSYTPKLTTQFKNFTYNFTMSDETDINSRIFIDIGNDINNVTIDSVSLKDCSVSTTNFNVNNNRQIKVNYMSIFPNPFNPSTSISIIANKKGEITIFNVNGKLIKKWSINSIGKHNYTFNASKLSTGIYIVKFQEPNMSITKKILFLK